MQLIGINQPSFGQLVLKRDEKGQKVTQEQVNAIYLVNDMLDPYVNGIIEDLQDEKHSDLVIKPRKNGNLDLYIRRELPLDDKNGYKKSFIPYDANGIKKLRASIKVKNVPTQEIKKNIAIFLEKCKKYVFAPLAEKNKEIDKKAIQELEEEFAKYLAEETLNEIADKRN